MAKISEVEIPSLLFDEQGSAPTTPGSTLWRAYFKSDGLYVIDDAGVETGPLGTGGGGGGGQTLIEEIDVGAGGLATFSFDAIPQTYRDLIIRGRLRTDNGSNQADWLSMRVGEGTVDSTAAYSWRGERSGTSTATPADESDDHWETGVACTSAMSDSGHFAHFEMTLIDYRHLGPRGFLYRAVVIGNSGNMWNSYGGGQWDNATDDIDIIEISPLVGTEFVQGSSLALFGIG